MWLIIVHFFVRFMSCEGAVAPFMFSVAIFIFVFFLYGLLWFWGLVGLGHGVGPYSCGGDYRA